MRAYYNLWHENISTYRMRQKIYLAWENFKTKWFSEKLDYRRLRTFKVKQQTELIMFELELLKHSRAHSIIHVALLESASDNAWIAKIMNVERYENQDYVVEKILAKNQIEKMNHYLVKWWDYDESENIWESMKHLAKTQQVLRSFLQCWDSIRNHQITQRK